LTARGPKPELIQAVRDRLLSQPALKKFLGKGRHRLLAFELVEPELEVKTAGIPLPPTQFLATIYDYAGNRSVTAEGRLSNPRVLKLSQSAAQPIPDDEEFREAVAIVEKDKQLGPLIRAQRLQAYRPMPPLVVAELPDGRHDRILAVGLLPTEKGVRHEIVGVNMIHQTVQRFEANAPPGAAAHNPICGLPNAYQATAPRGLPGQVWVTVTYGGKVVWKFLAVRPAASSGTNGSGVELRYVDYKGKRLLYRAHVPILNVSYDNNACGPYRDWQYQEGMIQANGWDPVPGFRLCPTPAQTILDTGSDVGNFLGVAMYVDGLEVVLVSEMQAGWYRYVSQWRLHVDGTSRPRFGFSGTSSSCVCTRHFHHAYWRLDFDVRTPWNNIVREYNNPCLPGFCPSNWHDKVCEIKRFRNPASQRKWRVENSSTHEAYDIIPGPNDGVASAMPDWPYGGGDVWILHYRGSEIDDGSVATGPPYAETIDPWVNGEWIYGQDVVVWYGAHFVHDVAAEPPGVFGDSVGPDLVPVKW